MKYSLVLIVIGLFIVFHPSEVSAVYLDVAVKEGDFTIQGTHVTVTSGTYTISRTFVSSTSFFIIPDDLITTIASEIPHETCLLQNYPNPFNPSTTIEFSLENPAHVLLTIYNIIGQRVLTLANGGYGAGPHRFVWNGRDDRGRNVSAGIYFYQLRTGGTVKTRKMLLLDGGGNRVSDTLFGQDNRAAKPANDPVLILDISAEKTGYSTVNMKDVHLPIINDHAQIDIELETGIAPGGYFPVMAVSDTLRFGTLNGYYELGYGIGNYTDVVTGDALQILCEVMNNNTTYLLYSDWPPFVPEILCVDDSPPLIRTTESNKLYVRFYDRDLLLYDFSGNTFHYTILLSSEMDHSDYFANHQDARSNFEGVSIETYLDEKGQVIATPGKYHENCLLIKMKCKSANNNNTSTWDQCFDRSAGLVLQRKDNDHTTTTFLIGGTIGGEYIGALPVSPNDPVTDRDIAEMVYMTMEFYIPVVRIVDVSNFAIHPPELFLESDGIEEAVSYLPPTICGIPLTIMTRQELQSRADQLGDYPFFSLSEMVIEDDKVTFELAYYMIKASWSHRDYVWGEGFTMQFQRQNGYWFGKVLSSWIS